MHFSFPSAPAKQAATYDDLITHLDQPKYFGRKGSQVRGADLVAAAQQANIDPRLLSSIVANESAWGSHPNAVAANNFSGMMGKGSELFKYDTPRAGLDAAAGLLQRRYVSKGLTTPAKIGPVYAPTVGATNDPNGINNNWVKTVNGIYSRLPEGKPPAAPVRVKGTLQPQAPEPLLVKGQLQPQAPAPLLVKGRLQPQFQPPAAPTALPAAPTALPSLPAGPLPSVPLLSAPPSDYVRNKSAFSADSWDGFELPVLGKAAEAAEAADEWRLYYFEGRNTGIAARSEEEARAKKRRGGEALVAVRSPSATEERQMSAGKWVRTRADGLAPGKSQVGGTGFGPRPKGFAKEASLNLIKIAGLTDKLWLSPEDRQAAASAVVRLNRVGYAAPSTLTAPGLSKLKGLLAGAGAGGLVGSGYGILARGGEWGTPATVGAVTGASLGGLLSLFMSDNRRKHKVRVSKRIGSLDQQGEQEAILASLMRDPASAKLLRRGDPISVMIARPERTKLQPFQVADDRVFVDDYRRELGKMASPHAHLNLVCRAVNTEPTEAQKAEGNYAKGHWAHRGLNFSIENPKDSIRKGKDRDGNAWAVTMGAHYGYLKGSVGADGDHLDVFLGPKLSSDKVFVIDQLKDGKFDEHKCVLFTGSEAEAKELYLACYSKGWKCGPITAMTWEEFKTWAMSDKTTKRLSKAAALHAVTALAFKRAGAVPSATLRRGIRPDGTEGLILDDNRHNQDFLTSQGGLKGLGGKAVSGLWNGIGSIAHFGGKYLTPAVYLGLAGQAAGAVQDGWANRDYHWNDTVLGQEDPGARKVRNSTQYRTDYGWEDMHEDAQRPDATWYQKALGHNNPLSKGLTGMGTSAAAGWEAMSNNFTAREAGYVRQDALPTPSSYQPSKAQLSGRGWKPPVVKPELPPFIGPPVPTLTTSRDPMSGSATPLDPLYVPGAKMAALSKIAQGMFRFEDEDGGRLDPDNYAQMSGGLKGFVRREIPDALRGAADMVGNWNLGAPVEVASGAARGLANFPSLMRYAWTGDNAHLPREDWHQLPGRDALKRLQASLGATAARLSPAFADAAGRLLGPAAQTAGRWFK